MMAKVKRRYVVVKGAVWTVNIVEK